MGADVVFTDISDAHGPALEAASRERVLSAQLARSNATDESAVTALIDELVGRHGRIDIAIDNVGNMPPPDRAATRIH